MKNLDIAKRFLGLQEVKDCSRLMAIFKQAGFNIDPSKTPWCAVFVNTIEKLAGRPGNGSEAAKSFLTLPYGHVETLPQPGDILVFKWDAGDNHVTFYVDTEGDEYKCLGGNQSDMVKYSLYPKRCCIGIRRTEES